MPTLDAYSFWETLIEEGRKARRDGKLITDCPYDIYTIMQPWWIEGYTRESCTSG